MYFQSTTLIIIILSTSISQYQCSNPKTYCKPTDTACWPTRHEINSFEGNLDGYLIQPGNIYYYNLTIMKYFNWNTTPGFIVLILSVEDVKASLSFAQEHNIRVTVQSSGHDMNGRSTAADSLQINFVLYNNISVNDTDSRSNTGATVTAQPGAMWIDVYKKVDRYNKQVVGGSCPTVTVSGYTMGGGHSAITRSYGLAVDNVVEFDLILVNGTHVTCTRTGTHYHGVNKDNATVTTTDTDLFWAVRGGGGGSFGILTSITFKLHDAPSGMVTYSAMYPLDMYGDHTIGKELLSMLFKLVPTLPKEWGGYLITSTIDDPRGIATATLTISLVHNGPWRPSLENDLKTILEFNPQYRVFSTFANYSSYLEYQLPTPNQTYFFSYMSNAFIRSADIQKSHLEFFAKDVPRRRVKDTESGCTCAIITGNGAYTTNKSDSSVSTDFRNGDFSCSLGVVYGSSDQGDAVKKDVAQLDDKIATLGKGAYLNEAAYTANNYKKRFWGDNYDQLSNVKLKYDPEGILTCHHCVHIDDNVLPSASTTQHIGVFVISICINIATFFSQ